LLLWSRATVRTGIAGDASFFPRHRSSVSPIASDPATSRPALRRALWRSRDALPRAARAAGERLIGAALARSPWLQPGSAIGLYVSRGSEVSTVALRALARRRGCRVYLPRITDFAARRMLLLPDTGAAMRLNRYRIAEPTGGAAIRPQALAVVLLPLVGFDEAGNRLGNGAGFYDRFLAGRHGRHGAPLLVGLAFECQRCRKLPAAAHDVPLDAVITERGIQVFNRKL
jgi:5-formyltetrahydrofolate cyclo-ligase